CELSIRYVLLPARVLGSRAEIDESPPSQGVRRATYIPMKILLVSQMYPGPEDPDLGVFVRSLEQELEARGNDVERAVLDRRAGGKQKYLRLARDTRAAARRLRPD